MCVSVSIYNLLYISYIKSVLEDNIDKYFEAMVWIKKRRYLQNWVFKHLLPTEIKLNQILKENKLGI